MFDEFKRFISRGNVVELAVGLIMATYFGAIVKSLVDDVIMPPVGYLIAGIDFSELKFKIGEKALSDGTLEAVTINYGQFLNNVLTFLIVSFSIFLIVRFYNRFLKKQKANEEKPPAPPVPTPQEQLLTEIRDLLKERS